MAKRYIREIDQVAGKQSVHPVPEADDAVERSRVTRRFDDPGQRGVDDRRRSARLSDEEYAATHYLAP